MRTNGEAVKYVALTPENENSTDVAGCSTSISGEVRRTTNAATKRDDRQAWVYALVEDAQRAADALPQCCEHDNVGTGFVYVVEAAGLAKIGQTFDVGRRMHGLQTNSPVRLRLVAIGRGARFEGMLHCEFDDARRHGEWFDADTVVGWVERTPIDRCISCSYRAPVHW